LKYREKWELLDKIESTPEFNITDFSVEIKRGFAVFQIDFSALRRITLRESAVPRQTASTCSDFVKQWELTGKPS